MNRTARSLLVVAAVVSTAGCTTLKSGRSFDYQPFGTKVQLGATDATQVKEWLGEPAGVGVEVTPDGSRNTLWTYYYFTGQLPAGSNVGFKMLQVRLNAQGKVVGYIWTGEIGAAQVEEKSSKK